MNLQNIPFWLKCLNTKIAQNIGSRRSMSSFHYLSPEEIKITNAEYVS